jgi:XRE family transcriptional regulator, master regulator for biofilm formation
MDGKRLKELRRRKGFTLDTLSEQTGISKSYLSLIERDIQSNPSLDILHRLAKTFDVQVEELVKIEKEDRSVGLTNSAPTVKGIIKVEIELQVEDMNSRKLEQIKEFIEKLKRD